MQYKTSDKGPFSTIFALLIMALIFIGLFMLARFIFRILAFLSPILLIVALVLDYKVVLNYGKWLISLVKSNALLGIAAVVLTVLGFPLVSAFLAGKAFLTRRMKKDVRRKEDQVPGEYIDFEEVDEEPLKLPELEKIKKKENKEYPPTEKPSSKKEDGRYDSLFD